MTQLPISMSDLWQSTYKTARRLVIAVVGVTVVLLGVVLVFTPGPALVVIPLGLAILATEFIWAKRLLQKMKARARSAFETLKSRRARSRGDAPRTSGVPDPAC